MREQKDVVQAMFLAKHSSKFYSEMSSQRFLNFLPKYEIIVFKKMGKGCFCNNQGDVKRLHNIYNGTNTLFYNRSTCTIYSII